MYIVKDSYIVTQVPALECTSSDLVLVGLRLTYLKHVLDTFTCMFYVGPLPLFLQNYKLMAKNP